MNLFKLLRNASLIIGGTILFLTVFVGILLTNSEIKFISNIVFSFAVFSCIMQICMLSCIKFKRQKRGVTFNKSSH